MGHPNPSELPAPATVVQLRTAARRNAIDPAHHLKEFQAKGLNDCFRGRNVELGRLRKIFLEADGTDARMRRGSKPYGALLYGAPGSGKSALIEYWRDLCASQEHAVVKMPAKSFRDDASFMAALKTTDEWKIATALARLGRTAGEIVSTLGETADEAVSVKLQAEYGVEVPPFSYELLGGLLHLGTATPSDATECLHALSAAFSNGWTIVVDEAEDWADFVGHGPTHNLIQRIGDPSMRSDANRLGGLLVGGLNDTVGILDDMKLTRFHLIRMGPLDLDTACDIIGDAMDRSAMPTELRDAIHGRWVETLARDFHHWPHHTRCAALAVRYMAEPISDGWRKEGRRRPEEFDRELEWARTTAANGAAQLYRARWRNANSGTDEIATRETVALARATDNVFHETQLHALLASRPQALKDHSVADWARRLLHSGLIEPIITDPDAGIGDESETQTKHYRMPIPSMAEHIEENTAFPPNMERVQAAVDVIEPELEIAAAALRRELAAV